MTSIMDDEKILRVLEETGVVTRGHFKLSSGRHSGLYAEKFRIFERPDVTLRLGEELAARFRSAPVDVVVSPAVGALVFGFATASSLGSRFIFCERESGEMKFRRGFGILAGERVLIVEDVVTTGKSVDEVKKLVPAGSLVGVGCLIDRTGRDPSSSGLVSLARLDAPSWEPSSCPLCREGVPFDSPGSRHIS